MFSIIREAIEQRKPVYVLTGDEEFLVRQFISSLKELIPPAERQFNFVVLTAEDVSGQQAVNQARTLPMFGKQKIVVVYSGHKWQEDDWKAIMNYSVNPAKHSILAVEAIGPNKNFRRRFSKIEKDLAKLGVLVKFDKLKPNAFIGLLADYCKNTGIHIDESGLETLAELSNLSLESAVNEIEKLKISYPDRHKFTEKDILNIAGIDREYNIFEFIDAVANRKSNLIARIGRNLSRQINVNLFQLITMLHKLMLYADTGRKYGTNAKRLQSVFQFSWWWANQTTKVIENYSEEEVNRIIALLYEYNKKGVGIKSGFSTQEELLEELALELSIIAGKLVAQK